MVDECEWEVIMALRNFAGPQNSAEQSVRGSRVLSWLELDCPECGGRTYIYDRVRPLARVGSQREYAYCCYCATKLTHGHIVCLPKPWRDRLRFWRRRNGGRTMKVKVS